MNFSYFILFLPIFYLFLVGLFGIFFVRRNMLIVLMSIELLLLSVNLNFIFFACLNDDMVGLLFSFFILTVAAAESAIGLSLLVVFFRLKSGNQLTRLRPGFFLGCCAFQLLGCCGFQPQIYFHFSEKALQKF